MHIQITVEVDPKDIQSLESELATTSAHFGRLVHGEPAAAVLLGIVAHSLIIIDVLLSWYGKRKKDQGAVEPLVLLPDGRKLPISALTPELVQHQVQVGELREQRTIQGQDTTGIAASTGRSDER